MASNFILFTLLFGIALVCQCNKISSEDSLSLLDLLSAELDEDTSEDITTRSSKGCHDVKSKIFCSRFRKYCRTDSGTNFKFMVSNCRWTCGCI
ncbi:hypothetical protein AWC38_SpisGene7347 [Stylophora pistillata]|uniref:ShKT domain-containing protein n=1 Tax=Stylophora pistillata TaxID=50429 RepID=A0A2B4SHB5_STYPI|nr:hypothetical protein AWC38_SpisGene7347 [Stylophora pistillata]